MTSTFFYSSGFLIARFLCLMFYPQNLRFINNYYEFCNVHSGTSLFTQRPKKSSVVALLFFLFLEKWFRKEEIETGRKIIEPYKRNEWVLLSISKLQKDLDHLSVAWFWSIIQICKFQNILSKYTFNIVEHLLSLNRNDLTFRYFVAQWEADGGQ